MPDIEIIYVSSKKNIAEECICCYENKIISIESFTKCKADPKHLICNSCYLLLNWSDFKLQNLCSCCGEEIPSHFISKMKIIKPYQLFYLKLTILQVILMKIII